MGDLRKFRMFEMALVDMDVPRSAIFEIRGEPFVLLPRTFGFCELMSFIERKWEGRRPRSG